VERKIGEMIGRSDVLFHETLFFYFLILGNISEKEDKKNGISTRRDGLGKTPCFKIKLTCI
jgi:hypothetical protein